MHYEKTLHATYKQVGNLLLRIKWHVNDNLFDLAINNHTVTICHKARWD